MHRLPFAAICIPMARREPSSETMHGGFACSVRMRFWRAGAWAALRLEATCAISTPTAPGA
eukprot:5670796-Prorocentrum_lima.AAC.1